MTFRDFIVVSTGNMWRMKFRAILTMMGVLIAITTFVAMISFGAGNQEQIENQFNKLGLFTTMQVFPKEPASKADTTVYAKLDKAALEKIADIPGVNLAYPYDALSITVEYGDSSADAKGQALPSAVLKTKLFSQLSAGTAFVDDTAKQVIISSKLAKRLGFDSAYTAIGKPIVVSVSVSQFDSGLAHIFNDKGVTLFDRLKKIHFDSLFNSAYRGKTIRKEGNEILRRFVNGFMNAREKVSDTLIICAVRDANQGRRLRIEDVIIPFGTAERFSTSGLAGGPMEMFMALNSGTFFADLESGNSKNFTRVTIDFDPKVPYTIIRDSVEAMGYRTFSFAAEFEQIQQAFLYLDLALGTIGLIALITASLGIVNTMVMSVNERKREIGVLKSLGADESDIRRLFLVESGIIGLLGTSGGILFGWGITRIVSMVIQSFMEKEGIPPIDLFALPWWLISIALAVGIGVSVLAGFYPAARAARVDPVAALRNE